MIWGIDLYVKLIKFIEMVFLSTNSSKTIPSNGKSNGSVISSSSNPSEYKQQIEQQNSSSGRRKKPRTDPHKR